MPLTPGIQGLAETLVSESNTADKAGSGRLKVFATPFMVALMERAALESVAPYLEPGQGTVGTMIATSHIAATPVGATVRAQTELTAVDGRMLSFNVRAYSGDRLIGEGTHQRCIIDEQRFMQKVAAKNS